MIDVHDLPQHLTQPATQVRMDDEGLLPGAAFRQETIQVPERY